MFYITVFPDTDYFLWQLQVQNFNFLKMHIDLSKVIILVGYKNEVNPKFIEYKNKVKNTGLNILFYQNTLTNNTYSPSIRPHLLKKFMFDNPHFENEYLFLHDVDIIFRKIPNFEVLKKENTWITAECSHYLGYEYLKTTTQNEELIDMMCGIIGISKNIIIKNAKNSGGAQYFGKGLNYLFWEKVENDCFRLYKYLQNIRMTDDAEIAKTGFKKNPNTIQAWTAGMWAELYNLWLFEFETEISNELDFAWATYSTEMYQHKNIFHNAGVTKKTKEGYFLKTNYVNESPFDKDLSFVTPEKACYYYVKEIEETKKWLEWLN